MQTHGRVVYGRSGFCGDFADRVVLQIDPFDYVPILGFEVLHDAQHATADLVVQIGWGDMSAFHFLGEGFECSLRGCIVAVVVDDSVPKDAVKPSDYALLVADVSAIDGFRECILQNVLSGWTRTDPFLKEAEKLGPHREKVLKGIAADTV